MRTNVLFRLRYQWLLAVLMLSVVGVSPAFSAGNESPAPSAQATFEKRCVRCHGAGGKGDGLEAKMKFWMKTPNWTDAAYMRTRSDDALFQMIKAGGPTGMPSYETEYNDARIKELVTFVRSFSGTPAPQKPASAPAPAPHKPASVKR